ncbi:hypothetical protein CLI75_12175, partial [Porphyromonas gingivalis]
AGVDWRGICTLLNKKYTKTQNAIGNPAYDALLMFKILLLETRFATLEFTMISLLAVYELPPNEYPLDLRPLL